MAKINKNRIEFKLKNTMPEMPVVCLQNGLIIANFSSGHSFVFEDGTVLPACDPIRVRGLELEAHELSVLQTMNHVNFHSIMLSFRINKAVEQELRRCCELFMAQAVNIILVPLPVMQVIHSEFLPKFDPGYDEDDDPLSIMYTPFRCIRVKDRMSKIIYCDKFCV